MKPLMPQTSSMKELEELENSLTEKQKTFAKTYVENGFHVGEAAKAAGYEPKGGGFRLLKRSKILRYIDLLKMEQKVDANVTMDRVIREAMSIAFADITNVVKELESGEIEIKEYSSIPSEVRVAIRALTANTTTYANGSKKTVLRIEMHPKQPALDLLGKWFGMKNQGGGKEGKQLPELTGLIIHAPAEETVDG